MHTQSLFSMLDQHMQPKTPWSRDHAPSGAEFSLDAGVTCRFLEEQVFGQLRAGCGGQGELSLLVLAADPAMLWSHVQEGLRWILHCPADGLKLQVYIEPACPFTELRRHAIYSMAGHLTELN